MCCTRRPMPSMYELLPGHILRLAPVLVHVFGLPLLLVPRRRGRLRVELPVVRVFQVEAA